MCSRKKSWAPFPPPGTDAEAAFAPAGCTDQLLGGCLVTTMPGAGAQKQPLDQQQQDAHTRKPPPNSQQPGLTCTASLPSPSPRVLLLAAAGRGLVKPPPLGTPVCGPGPRGQHFGACFSRGQTLLSQAASWAGSQGWKTPSSLAQTHTRGGGSAWRGALRVGDGGTRCSVEQRFWRGLASRSRAGSRSDAPPRAASSSEGLCPPSRHNAPRRSPRRRPASPRPKDGPGRSRARSACGHPVRDSPSGTGGSVRAPPEPAPAKKTTPQGRQTPTCPRTDGRSDGGTGGAAQGAIGQGQAGLGRRRGAAELGAGRGRRGSLRGRR